MRAVLAAAALVLAAAPAAASARPGRGLKLKTAAPGPLGLEIPETISVRVKNTGSDAATGVQLTARAPKGITVRPRRKRIGTLAPGHARTVKVKVTRGLAGLSRTKLKLRFSAGGRHLRTARRAVPVALGLAGRYFWTADPFDEVDNDAYYFVDAHRVIRGAPAGGLPTHCTTGAEGCVPYTYDPGSGALKIGDPAAGEEEGSVEDDGSSVTIEDESYGELAAPPAGTRYDIGWSGLFGGAGCTLSCTFVSSGLTLTGDGQFARSVAVTGSTPINSFAVLPADQHGTYTIAPHGRLELAYADGHTETKTLTVFLGADDKLDPGYGMLLDGALYTGPDF
jgi:hypothetical protein